MQLFYDFFFALCCPSLFANIGTGKIDGYYGSNGASHFGQMVPVITAQMMPFWFGIDGWHYGSNGASIDLD